MNSAEFGNIIYDKKKQKSIESYCFTVLTPLFLCLTGVTKMDRVYKRMQKLMYNSRSKVIWGFVALVITIYIFLNSQNWAWYNRASESHPCETPAEEMLELTNLAEDTRISLEKMNLTYFLIYGSLWGAIRNQKPLAWDNDFDIGLLSSEMKPEVEKDLIKELNRRRIDIYYRVWFGTYRVTRGNARGDLMLFRQNIFNRCVRLGIESWVFFINYLKHHTFPCRLIKKPLPISKFIDTNFTVPREGIEIQKYFYPDDWWVESKPKGC